MYHIILIAMVLTLSLGIWNLVHAAPRSVSLFVTPFVAYAAGGFFLCFGIFFAYLSAYPLQNGPAMLAFFVKAYVGVWFLLMQFRGDERTVRQVFMMVGTLMLTIVAIYYVQDHRAVALLTLMMVAFGYWLTTTYMRFLDGGR
jgi:hypothetical protein